MAVLIFKPPICLLMLAGEAHIREPRLRERAQQAVDRALYRFGRETLLTSNMSSKHPIPHYKLIYFPVRGRGEFIRYLFALAEVPYEEQIITFEEWPSKKPDTPFGTLPVLEIDHGKHALAQSVAIGRYLAKRFGLYGKDAVEQAKADMYVDGCVDLYPKFAPYFEARIRGDHEAMERNYNEFKEKQLTAFLDRYSAFLKQNDSGWFVGDRVSLADVYIGELLDRIDRIFDPGLLNNYPDLKEFVGRLHSLPGIAQRVTDRPSYTL